ncbi:MAG: branched-chain amino acid ABC transporter permease [Haloarculaceae archaeon]
MSGATPDAVGWVGAHLRRLSPGATVGIVLGVVLLGNAAVQEPGLFVDQAIGGMVYGMILVMLSLGLALVLGLMGVVNFAHGALFMLGGYFTYAAMATYGVPFPVALVLAPVGVGLIGILMEVVVLRRLYGKNPIIGLLATFGLTLMIAEAVRYVWGPNGLQPSKPGYLTGSTDLLVTQVASYRLFTVVVSVVSVVAVYYLISKTDFGLTVRAGVQDGEMTEFVGVNLSLRFTAMFFLGSVIAGLGGALRVVEFGVDPGTAEEFVILAFVVVVVGGVGSLFGSVVAGLIVGWSQFLVPAVLSSLAVTTGIGVLDIQGTGRIVPFVVMIVVLLLQPRGLFGEEGLLE